MRAYLALALVCLWWVVPILAQATPTSAPPAAGSERINAYLETSVLEAELGQPVPVRLIIEAPLGTAINPWPTLTPPTPSATPTSFWERPPFEVIDAGEVQITETETQVIYTQALAIVPWRVGPFITPEVPVTFALDGVRETAPLRSVAFNVRSVLPPDATTETLDLREPLPSISPFYLAPRLVLVLIVVMSAILWAVLALIALGSRTAPRLRVAESRRMRRMHPTLAALVRLKQRDDLSAIELYTAMADILRDYMKQRFELPAREMTTLELTGLLADRGWPVQLRDDLVTLLSQADLVKFANIEPALQDREQVLEAALRWVEVAESRELDRSQSQNENTQNENTQNKNGSGNGS